MHAEAAVAAKKRKIVVESDRELSQLIKMRKIWISKMNQTRSLVANSIL